MQSRIEASHTPMVVLSPKPCSMIAVVKVKTIESV